MSLQLNYVSTLPGKTKNNTKQPTAHCSIQLNRFGLVSKEITRHHRVFIPVSIDAKIMKIDQEMQDL